MAALLGDLIATIGDANHNNNQKLLPEIKKTLDMINSLADQQDKWYARSALRFLVTGIDGNRDNKSYYTLDAGREWIERRLSSTSGQLNQDLKATQAKIVDARDFLDEHAHVFVEGIKTLVKLTEGDARKESDQIKVTANAMTSDYLVAEQLKDKTLDALNAATNIQLSQQDA